MALKKEGNTSERERYPERGGSLRQGGFQHGRELCIHYIHSFFEGPNSLSLIFSPPLVKSPLLFETFPTLKRNINPPSSKPPPFPAMFFLHFCLFIQLKYERKIAGVKYCNTHLCFNFHAVFLLKGLQDWNHKNKQKDSHRLGEEEKGRHMVSG